jgi:nitrogen fixation/metabolism regulation signal transduction histidine kinase
VNDASGLTQEERRSTSRTLRVSLIFSVVLATLLLGLLALASGNTKLFESHYAWLLWFSLGVAALLLVLVVELVRRLVQRFRRGLFGTRLMARMAATFVAMTVIPVALIFLVAVQFIERSVESWFDLPVERALESGLNLGRTSMDSMGRDLLQKARGMAATLSEQAPDQWPTLLGRLREQGGIEEAMILTGASRVVAISGSQLFKLAPELPPANAMNQVRLTRQFSAIEAISSTVTETPQSGTATQPTFKGYQARAIVVITSDGSRPDDAKYLQLIQQVPTAVAENADAVQQGYRDYQELSLSRSGLKRVFRITLVLTFLLTLFSAIAGAFLLAGWLTGPLAELAAATRAVARGNYQPLRDYSGRDELGVLTESFNRMTEQLEDARHQVQVNQQSLEEVNARLESVLANLNAGVLVLDSQLKLGLANVGAELIMGEKLAPFLGRDLEALPRVGKVAAEIRQVFNESGTLAWQRQFELAGGHPDIKQTLFARGSVLEHTPNSQDAPGTLIAGGYVLVFDDVSELVSAQRAVAWAEVARRLAHEIKNPLTPIQLAAERLQMKLQDKLGISDSEMLEKSTRTIVNQVTALKYMVDEFRDYARLPSAKLDPLDLNALVDEILRLYSDSIVTSDLQVPLPLILGDATLLRQVVHNLLKNGLEATEKLSHAQVRISTQMVKLTDGQIAVRLCVRDNGGGFNEALLSRAFEPYVTTKPRGSGLGLPIVKKIIEEHGARIDISNQEIPNPIAPATDISHVAANIPAIQDRIIWASVNVLFTKLAKNEHNTSIK